MKDSVKNRLNRLVAEAECTFFSPHCSRLCHIRSERAPMRVRPAQSRGASVLKAIADKSLKYDTFNPKVETEVI